MIDYASARLNMVQCQLHPCGVNTQRVLDAYNAVPRENFVTEAQCSIAYSDNNLPLGHERYLLAPILHARMVHAVNIGPDDVVLDIGGATGYSAAILSQLATTVVALENHPDFVAQANKALLDLDLLNILHRDADLQVGDPKHAPFDVIFINGAVSAVPQELLDQLAIGGRLCCIERDSDHVSGNVVLLTKHSDAQIDKEILFEARSHYLPGFEPSASSFKF